jgi:hypothetical protein
VAPRAEVERVTQARDWLRASRAASPIAAGRRGASTATGPPNVSWAWNWVASQMKERLSLLVCCLDVARRWPGPRLSMAPDSDGSNLRTHCSTKSTARPRPGKYWTLGKGDQGARFMGRFPSNGSRRSGRFLRTGSRQTTRADARAAGREEGHQSGAHDEGSPARFAEGQAREIWPLRRI